MSTPGHRTVARSGYREYIKSAAWRAKRAEFWRSDLPKQCYGCGTNSTEASMHLHHRTYKNLGRERLLDLVPVCESCHREIHRLHNTDPRWRRKGLWAVTNFVADQRGGRAARARSNGHQPKRGGRGRRAVTA